MNSYAFLVCHRTIDLVAATAAATLRDALGLGGRLLGLRRDDAFLLEHCEGESGAWAQSCVDHAAWFNPNTHRHAFFAASEGALDAALALTASGHEAPPRGVEWPLPWLGALLHTDRADLLSSRSITAAEGQRTLRPENGDRACGSASKDSPVADPAASTDLLAWLALPSGPGAFSVSLAAFDAEDPVHRLAGRAWPTDRARVMALQLWTLALRAESAAAAEEIALDVALTRRRHRGLLIHPQVQGWALAAPVTPLSEESS